MPKLRVLTDGLKHNGEYLEKYEVYDFPDETAKSLLEVGGVVEEYEGEKKAADLPAPKKPEKFDPTKSNEPRYLAEAKIDPDKRKELESEGKLNDPEPVGELKKEKDPKVVIDTYDAKGNLIPPEKAEEIEKQTVETTTTMPDDTGIGKEQ